MMLWSCCHAEGKVSLQQRPTTSPITLVHGIFGRFVLSIVAPLCALREVCSVLLPYLLHLLIRLCAFRAVGAAARATCSWR